MSDSTHLSSPVARTAYNELDFKALGVLDAWEKYDDVLTWGRGQCLAVLDGGCAMNEPEWKMSLPWGPKVVATSSSNGYAAGAFMVLREAIEKARYDWKADGKNLPDAVLVIIKKTGTPVTDAATGISFRALNLLKALDSVFSK